MFWLVMVVVAVAVYLVVDKVLRLFKVGNHINKYVIITGCDSGFGRDLAIRLDKMGFPVFAGCLMQESRQSLEAACSSRLKTLSLNVADPQSIGEALVTVKQNLPSEQSLWAVVNNAGVAGPLGTIEMLKPEAYLSACSVNLFGAIEMSRVFMPLLRRSQGRLVLMTSVMGRCAATSAPYSVSKYGLEAFGDVCRREVSSFGVKVAMIEPGYFQTNIINLDKLKDNVAQSYQSSDPEVQAAYGPDFVSNVNLLFQSIWETSSPDTYKVVDAYVDAITCAYPRSRYVVGFDAKFVFVSLSFLPDWFSDWFLAKQRKRLVENSKKAK